MSTKTEYEFVPAVEHDDGEYERSYYKIPEDKIAKLKEVFADIVPYVSQVESHNFDPALRGAIKDLFNAAGWETSSLYC